MGLGEQFHDRGCGIADPSESIPSAAMAGRF
jgi:hypothetical protein